ncbi:MAG: Hpt domain-containing protein, partial [Oscillospiraceae bacterium]
DIKGTMDRFLDDSDLLFNCLCEFSKDNGFELMKQAISQKNYNSVFENAHSLKGVAANLGLTPIFDSVCKIVELVREKSLCDDEKLNELSNELEANHQVFLDILNQ